MSDDKVSDLLESGRPLERISALEAGQERLSRDVSHLASAIQTQGTETRRSLSEINKNIANSQKTNWPTIISLASVLLIICGGVFGIIVRDNSRIENVVNKLSESHMSHITTGGHHGVFENEKKILHLDEVLQREMRLLDSKALSELKELDRRLQQEMRLLHDIRDEKIKALERKVFVEE